MGQHTIGGDEADCFARTLGNLKEAGHAHCRPDGNLRKRTVVRGIREREVDDDEYLQKATLAIYFVNKLNTIRRTAPADAHGDHHVLGVTTLACTGYEEPTVAMEG